MEENGATLEQAGKVMSLLKGSGREHLQAHLESGLMADLLKADPRKIDRRAFKKAVGLPCYLKQIGEVTIPAKKSFDVKKYFYIDQDGYRHLCQKTEGAFGEFSLACYKLEQEASDPVILDELGEDKLATSFFAIHTLQKRQRNGERGVLLTNGAPNIFYVYDFGATNRPTGYLVPIKVVWAQVEKGKDKFAWFTSIACPFPGYMKGARIFATKL